VRVRLLRRIGLGDVLSTRISQPSREAASLLVSVNRAEEDKFMGLGNGLQKSRWLSLVVSRELGSRRGAGGNAGAKVVIVSSNAETKFRRPLSDLE